MPRRVNLWRADKSAEADKFNIQVKKEKKTHFMVGSRGGSILIRENPAEEHMRGPSTSRCLKQ